MTDREQTRQRAEALVRIDGRGENNAPWPNELAPSLARDILALLTELEQAERRYEEVFPLVASLTIYGERVNIAALVAKARALNEPQAREQARSD